MNWQVHRNPARLINAAGLSAVQSRRDENGLLQALTASPTLADRPLVLVVGGFLDQFLLNSYAVCAKYPADLAPLHDVFFREHYEGKACRALVEFYHAQGQPVVLIGHSWGGDTVVNAIARRTTAAITLLVTLDPVSCKGAPLIPLPHVAHWLNIYVNYRIAPWCNLPNLVARIGSPWEAVCSATTNIPCALGINHAWAYGMFIHYAEPVLRQTLATPIQADDTPSQA